MQNERTCNESNANKINSTAGRYYFVSSNLVMVTHQDSFYKIKILSTLRSAENGFWSEAYLGDVSNIIFCNRVQLMADTS